MSERIEAYGRVNGKVRFHYRPKNFDADWGGVFDALEIAGLLQDTAEVLTGRMPLHHKLGKMEVFKKFVGSATETLVDNLALGKCLEQIDMCMLDIDNLMISGVKTKPLWVDQVLPSGLITSTAQLPSERLAEALLKMDLNKWGVVRQIGLVLSLFTLGHPSGQRSVSVFLQI